MKFLEECEVAYILETIFVCGVRVGIFGDINSSNKIYLYRKQIHTPAGTIIPSMALQFPSTIRGDPRVTGGKMRKVYLLTANMSMSFSRRNALRISDTNLFIIGGCVRR